MQEFVAVAIPVSAVLVGLIALRAVRLATPRSTPDILAAVLLVVYGALTLNNLAVRGLEFMGTRVVGYAPRYAAVAFCADLCLIGSILAWVWARISTARAASAERPLFGARDVKVMLLQLGAVALFLVVAGVAMETLRNQGILPW